MCYAPNISLKEDYCSKHSIQYIRTCCCCLPCNHCSNGHGLLRKFWPFGNRLRSTHCREFLNRQIEPEPGASRLRITLLLADECLLFNLNFPYQQIFFSLRYCHIFFSFFVVIFYTSITIFFINKLEL